MDKLRAFLVLRLLAGFPILDDTLVRVCHLLMGRGLIAAAGAVVLGVAGNNAMGHVTSDSRRKPFQLARGAILKTPPVQNR